MTQIQLVEFPNSSNVSFSGAWTKNLHLFGSYGKSKFTFATCNMVDGNTTEANRQEERPAWPAGNYCIYKTDSDCPAGEM